MVLENEQQTTLGRRAYLRAVGAAATFGGVGASGLARQDQQLKIGLSTHFTSGAWVTALVEAGQFYAEDQGYDFTLFTTGGESQKQISDIRRMVNQEFDGIVLIPFNTEAIAGAVEEADQAGVPVVTVDIDAATPADKLHVSWDDAVSTRRAAELLVENLREQHPDRESYRILEVRAPPGRDIARLRHEPFVELIEETEGFEVAGTVVGDWVRSEAKQRTQEWINANEAPDGIYSANFLMSLGALAALEEMDLAAPKGDDEHIVMTQLDGSANTHENILDGFIDAAVDQPNYFYAPLAMAWLERIVTEGEDVLPEVGTTVVSGKGAEEESPTPANETAEATPSQGASITIEPATHRDIELWQEPIWSPATIEEAFGHRQFVTDFVEITEENADAPYLWGNIWGPDAALD